MKKFNLRRLFSTIVMALTLGVLASFTVAPATASAANVNTNNVGIQSVEELKRGGNEGNGGGGANGDSIQAGEKGDGQKSGSNTADDAYYKVVNFFLVWFRRAGFLVALVGAIMFGFAIKNNDAEQKQNGILTMVGGFVVGAVCLGAKMFDLFT